MIIYSCNDTICHATVQYYIFNDSYSLLIYHKKHKQMTFNLTHKYKHGWAMTGSRDSMSPSSKFSAA